MHAELLRIQHVTFSLKLCSKNIIKGQSELLNYSELLTNVEVEIRHNKSAICDCFFPFVEILVWGIPVSVRLYMFNQ